MRLKISADVQYDCPGSAASNATGAETDQSGIDPSAFNVWAQLVAGQNGRFPRDPAA